MKNDTYARGNLASLPMPADLAHDLRDAEREALSYLDDMPTLALRRGYVTGSVVA